MHETELRTFLRPLVKGLKDSVTHEQIGALCCRLGLPIPPAEGSKADRLAGSFDALPDDAVPRVAAALLEHYPPKPADRNRVQDLVWEKMSPVITKKARREAARALQPEDLYIDRVRFDHLLDNLWIMDDGSLANVLQGRDTSLAAQVERHVHRNPGDWTVEELFDKLGAS